MEPEKFKCSQCEKTFTQKKNLYALSRKFHQIELVTEKVKTAECNICDEQFSNEQPLNNHQKKYHQIQTSTTQTRIKCPHETCKRDLFTFAKLRDHLVDEHNINIELQEITFNNMTGS